MKNQQGEVDEHTAKRPQLDLRTKPDKFLQVN
jgi:hypothetical protein